MAYMDEVERKGAVKTAKSMTSWPPGDVLMMLRLWVSLV